VYCVSLYVESVSVSVPWNSSLKLKFHGTDTDTDSYTDTYILADFRARKNLSIIYMYTYAVFDIKPTYNH